MELEELTKVRDVLRRKNYLLLTLLISVAAFTFYAVILNFSLLVTMFSAGKFGVFIQLIPDLTRGYIQSTTYLSLAMSGTISLAIGVNFALVAFRLVEMSEIGKEGAGSFGGMAVAVVAPACPACATTLFAYAGLSTFFAMLPFKGTEIKVLALFFLVGSALWIAREINRDVCDLPDV